MSAFELAVLGVLAREGRPLGWYQIEQRLSVISLDIRPNLIDVLAALRQSGLVDVVDASGAATLYEITEAGKRLVRELREQR